MAESKVRDENYFTVSGWMLNRLELKGIALHVFSIIYGFSQDGESCFTGSLQYLMDFTNASKPTIIKALKELVERNFVTKIENEMNGVKFCKYRVNLPVVKEFNRGSQETLPGGSQVSLPGGSKETLPNIISLNNKSIKNNNDKDIYTEKVQTVINLYHDICESFPTIRAVSEARKKAIISLLKSYKTEDFEKVFENAEASSFLRGANGGWKANFDWMMKEANFLKVLEGNYADKGRKEIVPAWAQETDYSETLALCDKLSRQGAAQPNPELEDRAQRLRESLGQV